jgi:hypothetical protein
MDEIEKCSCGGSPVVRMARGGEDTMETWVECPHCGTHTDYVEDAYADKGTAIWLWNDGERCDPRAPERSGDITP